MGVRTKVPGMVCAPEGCYVADPFGCIIAHHLAVDDEVYILRGQDRFTGHPLGPDRFMDNPLAKVLRLSGLGQGRLKRRRW